MNFAPPHPAKIIASLFAALLLAGAAPGGVRVEPGVVAEARLLPVRVGGRVVAEGNAFRRQWPGTYFEMSFEGSEAGFVVGEGDAILHVIVDGRAVARLVRPRAGAYRVAGLAAGRHELRVEVASESQAGASVFGGFSGGAGTRPLPRPARPRQIEFIGDSHTVGYGNTSPTRECTSEEVWLTTDTSKGIAPLTARRFGADYQVNAISGRGIVRNYDGHAADTLPEAYPHALLGRSGGRWRDPAWRPDVVVIALGTNDFSTPLKAGERWPTREALRADFRNRYVGFVKSLRARSPKAWFILWATDLAGGEIEAEVGKVAERLRAAGDSKVAFLPVRALDMSGCHHHPSVADGRRIADAISAFIDSRNIWGR